MSEPISTGSYFYAYTAGSFDSSSGYISLFADGTYNYGSGVMPLSLLAKSTSSGFLSLFMPAFSKTSSWEGMGSLWNSYSLQCDIGATSFCQDWEHLPYSQSQATGVVNNLPMLIKGAYRVSQSGVMPMFMSNIGDGIINKSMPMVMYAVNNDSQISSGLEMSVFGHGFISSQITMALSGAMPSSSGAINLYCGSYDNSDNDLKLFLSGI